MTGPAHRLFGLAFGAGAGALMADTHDLVIGAIVFWAALPGSTAPDWLEMRIGGRSLIRHRTLTHWPIPWLALGVFGFTLMSSTPIAGAGLLGFAVGGCSHLLGDAGTPMGVPVFTPYGARYSFRLWRGHQELLPVVAAWVSAIYLVESKVL